MGKVFKPKVPKTVVQAPTPAPEQAAVVEEPQLGADTATSKEKKNRGKRGLKIERSAGAGRNIV